MAKKKAKEIQEELLGSAHKVWLAGLGALSMAEEESGKLFKNLIKRGEDVEKRGKDHVDRAMETVGGVKTVAESYWETFERMVDDKVTAVIHRLGVPTKDEIEDLTKKVEDLTQSIDKLRSKEAKPAAKGKAK
jgi:poly(hydroxyalkanoate) granule-associated protein